jgi:antitoxin ParD1/3/4
MKKRILHDFLTISLNPALKAAAAKKVQTAGTYSSTSDYVRDLIRRDLQRDQLDQLITEGKNAPRERVTAQWWKERHAELERHRRARGTAKKAHRKRA